MWVKEFHEQMQLRRGAERAVIFSLSFSLNAQWLAVSSDKGTVHVFSLKVESAQRNKCVSRLSFIKGTGLASYFLLTGYKMMSKVIVVFVCL